MIVDATTGEVLRRMDGLLFFGGTQSIAMRVYTSDSPQPGSPGNATPNQFQFPFVPRQLVTINPGDVSAWSPNGWINDGVNETLGNNVDAHTDLNADNNPDLPRPTGAPFRTFDFPLDVTQAPSTYRNAATTQLFYLCNRYHDRLFALGFDEAAKNFQTVNFSAQGVGNDAVQADCQDGSGTNNANFGTTGSDGSVGRMQMYVFDWPTPDRDGDLDADIVYHEYLAQRPLGQPAAEHGRGLERLRRPVPERRAGRRSGRGVLHGRLRDAAVPLGRVPRQLLLRRAAPIRRSSRSRRACRSAR
jgi:hypothetical protein